ncbi:MAG: class II glutamine amidotransferase [Archangium gephyra]|uniref:Class II glutamine amidotransferase n=1 Tax=Archangium gephyra TaxID=48 RepID=A0A2W5TQ52_9BACT|nr:MAG: class II glutamine amidotransferase [Archangium gephyra]
MSQVLALITSDAALLRCELDRVRQRFALDSKAVVGVGGWQDGQVVQRSYGVGVPLDDAWEAPESEAVMVASRVLGVGQGVDNGTQPFRFRQWLFAAAGGLEKSESIRERLREELPEFLQGAVRGPTWEEIAFAHFLAGLREIGRIEDSQLDPDTAATKLAAAAKAIEQVSASVGVSARPAFSLVASNGRLIVATSRGGARLSYTLLEGRSECERHELKEGETAVRDHRRLRSVVVASGVEPGDGWVALPDGATLAVDRRLSVTIR